MYFPLTEATLGKPLVIERMVGLDLAMRLRRMGLFEGSEIIRMEKEVLVRPVRVRGPKGDAVLGGGMAMKIVVHLDDGGKRPLMELKPGESGHIEGLTAGGVMVSTLARLGLGMNDRVALVRVLPPMEYVTLVRDGDRVRLTEGMAAKIWGRIGEDRPGQFVSSRTGEEFQVEEILGGDKAGKMLQARGIEPGRIIVLEAVAQAQTLQTGVRNPIVIASREGLRLFLTPQDGRQILVREAEATD